jgi:hypothetical protein
MGFVVDKLAHGLVFITELRFLTANYHPASVPYSSTCHRGVNNGVTENHSSIDSTSPQRGNKFRNTFCGIAYCAILSLLVHNKKVVAKARVKFHVIKNREREKISHLMLTYLIKKAYL